MLHRPLEHATPSQRLANAGRIERLARIASRGVPDSPIALHVPKFIEPTPIEVAPAPLDNWAERQKAIPIPKAPWFFVTEELGEIEPGRPTIDQIQKACCRHFNLTRTALLAHRRSVDIVFARQVAMYLCKALTLRSLKEIGRRFSGRDHTTILHSERKIKRLIAQNSSVAEDVETIRAELGA